MIIIMKNICTRVVVVLLSLHNEIWKESLCILYILVVHTMKSSGNFCSPRKKKDSNIKVVAFV